MSWDYRNVGWCHGGIGVGWDWSCVGTSLEEKVLGFRNGRVERELTLPGAMMWSDLGAWAMESYQVARAVRDVK